jgi:hypothetical protein
LQRSQHAGSARPNGTAVLADLWAEIVIDFRGIERAASLGAGQKAWFLPGRYRKGSLLSLELDIAWLRFRKICP